jgi:hypothetical protein
LRSGSAFFNYHRAERRYKLSKEKVNFRNSFILRANFCLNSEILGCGKTNLQCPADENTAGGQRSVLRTRIEFPANRENTGKFATRGHAGSFPPARAFGLS